MMAQRKRIVTGGVDTHLDVHVAAVIDEVRCAELNAEIGFL